MTDAATIAGGFAEVEAGAYLAGRGQPAACLGDAVRRRRKGFFLRDRGSLDLVATSGRAWFADSSRPFLTHIPCAAPVSAVSAKGVLQAFILIIQHFHQILDFLIQPLIGLAVPDGRRNTHGAGRAGGQAGAVALGFALAAAVSAGGALPLPNGF